MRVFKNRLVQRIIILGLSFVVITVALFVKQNRPPGKIAGTVTNPILVANKFCDDPANSQQAACINFISDVLAQAGSPTYQDVTGNVGITGNTHITGTTSIGTEDITNKLNVEGGDIGVRSGSSIRLYNPVNNAYSTLSFDGTQTNFTWPVKASNLVGNVTVSGDIISALNGSNIPNTPPATPTPVWNAGSIKLTDTGNNHIWQIANRGEAEGSDRNYLRFFYWDGSLHTYFTITTAGNASIAGCLYYNGGTLGTCLSDIKLKSNINPFNLGLQEILGLKPVTYQFNGLGGIPDNGQTKTGLIAQDVEKVAPSLVNTQSAKLHPNDTAETELKAVDYNALTFALINAVKEQQTEIDALKKEVEELKKK